LITQKLCNKTFSKTHSDESGFNFLTFGFTKFGVSGTFTVVGFLFGVLWFGHIFLMEQRKQTVVLPERNKTNDALYPKRIS
jgi:hypothetical protein